MFALLCFHFQDFLTFSHVSPIKIKHMFSKRDLAKRAAAVASITVNNTDKFTALKLAHITRARRGVILCLTVVLDHLRHIELMKLLSLCESSANFFICFYDTSPTAEIGYL